MIFAYVLFNPNTKQYGYINVSAWENYKSIQGTDTPTAATLFSTEEAAAEWENSTWEVVPLKAGTPALDNLPEGWRWRRVAGVWEAYHPTTDTSITLKGKVIHRKDIEPRNLGSARLRLLSMETHRIIREH